MSLRQLQGIWNITEVEVDGTRLPASGQIVIKDSTFTTSGMGAEYSGTVSVTPKNLDLHFSTGPEAGTTSLGIYKFDGDRLRFCLTVTAKARPKQFATSPGSGLALETLQRGDVNGAKPDAATIPADLPSVPELDGEWQMLSCLMGPKPLPAEYIKSGRRTAANSEFSVTVAGQTMMKGHFSADRSTTPRHIDYYIAGPGKSVRHQLGIWKLENGILTTCIAPAGQARPAAFAAGSANTLSTWRLLG